MTETVSIVSTSFESAGQVAATVRLDDLTEALSLAIECLDGIGEDYDADNDARRTRLVEVLRMVSA